MTLIGYHASHEQLSPRALLDAVQEAESAGFDAAMCSDHLAPWTRAQGESGFAWSWLGAALAATTFSLGVVTAPGQRYHPAIIAQAIATLEEMFPGRFWAALGSGEAINEHVTGDAWPDKAARDERLLACADVIRRLLNGERVTTEGPVRVHDARIWSLPDAPPPIIGAAVSTRTAAWAAGWADGLVTVGSDAATTQPVRSAYREHSGTGETMLQLHLSFGRSEEEALDAALDQWSHSTVPPELMWELERPEQFEARAEPSAKALRDTVLISASADEMADGIVRAAAGFDRVYLHEVGKDQRTFLRRCEDELLPAIRSRL